MPDTKNIEELAKPKTLWGRDGIILELTYIYTIFVTPRFQKQRFEPDKSAPHEYMLFKGANKKIIERGVMTGTETEVLRKAFEQTEKHIDMEKHMVDQAYYAIKGLKSAES